MSGEIPPWLTQDAAGAARAAHKFNSEAQTTQQRQRFKRLIKPKMKTVWRELTILRGKPTQVSGTEWEIAQYEIFRAAYLAPELPQRTKTEITERKAKLTAIGKQLQEIAAADPQLAMEVSDMIRLYLIKHRNGINAADGVLAALGHCLSRASREIRRVGPAPVLGKARGKNVRQTTVIRYIAETVERHVGGKMYGTVAKLAGASLNKNISEQTVRRSLDPGR